MICGGGKILKRDGQSCSQFVMCFVESVNQVSVKDKVILEMKGAGLAKAVIVCHHIDDTSVEIGVCRVGQE